jgi:nitrous oxidase accessory protein NosD
MRKSAISCVLLLLVGAPAAHAQVARAWVSGLGDDASPNCSRTAPCKTFASAINKTISGGYIDTLDAGGFGTLTVTKSITIDGNGSHAGVLAGGVTGITINARGVAVVLRNLSIEGYDGATYGIRVVSAGRVVIENCTISGFGTGILVSGAADVTITDTTVKKSVNEGIYLQSGNAVLTRVTASGNGGTGILAGASAVVTVKDSVSSHNGTGFGAAFSASSQMDIESSVATNNDFGLIVLESATVRVSNSTIVNSSTNAMYNDSSGNLLTFGTNRFANNASPGVFTGTVLLR